MQCLSLLGARRSRRVAHGLFSWVLALGLATAWFPAPVWSAPGDLDPTFGTGGIVTTAFPNGHDLLFAAALQPDGKIVAAGFANMLGTGQDFAVTRYLPDGSLDPTLDGDGIVTTPIGEGWVEDYAFALAVQPDGKIVAAGSTYVAASLSFDFALTRYYPDGTLDPSFDGDGKVVTPVYIAGADDHIQAIALQPDGKIVVAGFTTIANHIALARYNPDGTLDTSFGEDGKINTGINRFDAALAVVVQPDGKIVAAGFSQTPIDVDFALVRYNPDGSPDLTFGQGGFLTTRLGSIGRRDFAQAAALQPDGKIIVAGMTQGSTSTNYDFALVRYNSDGSLDTTFDGDGILITPIGPGASPEAAHSIVLQPDGYIVVAGHSYTGPATSGDFAVVRYAPDGTLDPSFDGDGIAITPVGPGAAAEFVQAMVLQPDGKIVVGGYADMGINTGADFALVRYNRDGSLDPSLDGDGKVTTAIGTNAGSNYAHAATLQYVLQEVAAPDDGQIEQNKQFLPILPD